MPRRRQETKAAPSEPQAALPMDSTELEEIGIRLFGRVGWPIKVARIVSRDATTVRRWRAGGQVEPVYAKMIRDYAANVDPEAPSWTSPAPQADHGVLQALKMIARVQAMSALGAAVSILVTDGGEGLSLQLRMAGCPPVVAWQDVEGALCGLDDMERELARIWQGFSSRE